MESKTLSQWWSELSGDKKRWLIFYSEFLGQSANPARLYRAINLYGKWPVFEAIVDSAQRDLTGIKLNYVLKVASNKWKESQEALNDAADYSDALEKSKKATQQANKALEKRIIKRKGRR